MQIIFPNGQIGQRIRQLRREKALTPEELAKAAACPLVTLFRVEAGTLLEMDHAVFSRLCAALGEPMEILTAEALEETVRGTES